MTARAIHIAALALACATAASTAAAQPAAPASSPAMAKQEAFTTDEADAYRQMLVSVANKAAEASKEGGFLGFGGVWVSDKEQAFVVEAKKAAGIA